MRNGRLDKLRAGIKIGGRNINNLRYTDEPTLMAESEEKLKSLLRLLVFLPAVLIPACNSSSLAFHMICSAYKLNKQGDNKQPCTPFSVPSQSVVPYRILTVAF